MGRLEELIEKFRGVAGDRLTKVTEGVASLGRAPDDAEVFAVVVRELHTLKGEAQLLGFRPIAKVAHGLEKISEDHERHQFDASCEAIALMRDGFALVDRLRVQARDDEQGGEDAAAYAERVKALLE